jgi:hypothetical protein
MNAMSRLLISVSFLIATSDVYAWSLVYAHDAAGVPTFGSVSSLRNAIGRGADVKVAMDQAYYASCDGVHVNSDGSVSCMHTSPISVRNALPGPNFGFQDDAYHWFVMVNTTGQRDMSRWSVGEHTDRGHTQDTTSIRWFINN